MRFIGSALIMRSVFIFFFGTRKTPLRDAFSMVRSGRSVTGVFALVSTFLHGVAAVYD